MLKHASKISLRIRTVVVAALAGVTAAGLGGQTASAQFDQNDVIRMNRSNPIIFRNLFPSAQRNDGNNINGPSMIRIPDFIPSNRRANSNARYYLYFAHHAGNYIRMAWSRDPDRNFTLFRPGSGVMDDNNRDINLDQGILLRNSHIASPDVHVDEANRRFIMYFHHGGPVRFNGTDFNSQSTFVNTSSDGLNFRLGDIEPVRLGGSYFKVWTNRNTLYAVTNDGGPARSPSFNNPFSPPPGYYDAAGLASLWPGRRTGNLLRAAVPEPDRRVRHSGVLTQGNNLRLFYSIRGDSPERIFLSTIGMTSDFNNWTVRIPGTEILRAVGGWEEGHRAPSPSVGGPATNVNQLRDPDIFQDTDGSLYMYYTGGGEEGIGVCALQSNRQAIRIRAATHDAETRRGSDSNRNFRSNTVMTLAGGRGTSDRRGYFRFPTPGSAQVRAAVLRVYLPNNESGNLEVFGTSNFREGTITGNNRPNPTTGVLDRVPLGFRGHYELDVTSYVNSNRNGNIRLLLRPTSTSGVQITTSENGNRSRRPGLKWMQRQ